MRSRHRLVHALALLAAFGATPGLAGVELRTETSVQGGGPLGPGSKAPGGAPRGAAAGAAGSGLGSAGEAAAPGGGARPGQTLSGKLLIDGGRVRIEGTSSGATRHAGAMIYRPDRQVLWVLDETDHQYVEMGPATARAMRSAVDAARVKMTEQLAKMKPEERAAVERAMKAQGIPLDGGAAGAAAASGASASAAAPVAAAVKATGKSDSVSGLGCREFEVVRDEVKVAETCVAPWTSVGVAKSDLDGLRKLALFQNEMFSTAGFQGLAGPASDDSFAMMDKLDGLPIRIRTFRDGVQISETRVVEVARRQVDPALFEVPAGYKPRTLMPGQGPGKLPERPAN